MSKLLLSLLICLSWPVFGPAQTAEIVGPAATPEGRLVRLEARGDFDSCVWFTVPMDRADGVQVDSRHYVFTGPAGTYTAFLVTLKGQTLGQAAGTFAIGPGPEPPGPGPEPEPDFPISAGGRATAPPLSASLNDWGQFYTRQLGRAYATAFNRAANSIDAGKSMEEVMAGFEIDFKNARAYAFKDLRARLNVLWPEGKPLDAANRPKVSAGFRQFANGLKGVK